MGSFHNCFCRSRAPNCPFDIRRRHVPQTDAIAVDDGEQVVSFLRSSLHVQPRTAYSLRWRSSSSKQRGRWGCPASGVHDAGPTYPPRIPMLSSPTGPRVCRSSPIAPMQIHLVGRRLVLLPKAADRFASGPASVGLNDPDRTPPYAIGVGRNFAPSTLLTGKIALRGLRVAEGITVSPK